METLTTAHFRAWVISCSKTSGETAGRICEEFANQLSMNYPKTLGELKKSGYQSRSIKDELRDNLIEKLRNRETVFEGIWGYEETVIPDLERAILAGHDINLLGLRGQAKTRLARLMVNLLD